MKWSNNIKLSVTALVSNKPRLLFSVLGMAVGIAAVITTLSIGEGARAKALGPIRSMGTNLLVINPSKTNKVYRDRQKAIDVTTLNMKDIKVLREANHLRYISPFQQMNGTATCENQSIRLLIQGTSEEYAAIRDYRFSSGCMFSKEENNRMAKVAVVGNTTAKTLFGSENPIGKEIRVNTISFSIIGVLEKKGLEAESGNIDNVVIIPINTFLRRMSNVDYLTQIYLSADKPENSSALEKDAIAILRQSHRLEERNRENDFEIINQISSLKAAEKTASGFNILIMGVAAVSLIVGGVGILALMILSVKERTTEIGLRISVGARRKDIVGQFLSESFLIGLAGGLTGIILGIFSSWLTSTFTSWETSLSWGGILVPFLFSLMMGLIFGAFPSYRAARLDPVNALRNE